MFNVLRMIIVFAAAGVIGLSIANAAEEAKNPFEKAIQDRFNAMDANKDGKIDYNEYIDSYQNSIKSSFDKRDQNKDGALSKEEFMPQTGAGGMMRGSKPFPGPVQGKQPEQQQEKPVSEGKTVQEKK